MLGRGDEIALLWADLDVDWDRASILFAGVECPSAGAGQDWVLGKRGAMGGSRMGE